jgi:hypothetical protein
VKELPLQPLLMVTPVKFHLWNARCGNANAMVGFGPVHVMPAFLMPSSPPSSHRLHFAAAPASATPVAAAGGAPAAAVGAALTAAAAAVAAAAGGPPKCCAQAVTSKQERTANQPAAAQPLQVEAEVTGSTYGG